MIYGLFKNLTSSTLEIFFLFNNIFELQALLLRKLLTNIYHYVRIITQNALALYFLASKYNSFTSAIPRFFRRIR
ncbi:hypothetical protein EZS27_039735, partial [termite gut metagenome]